jgi:hypothetical protein
VDENPRVRAGVKRRPAKQIPLSPQQSEGGVDESPRVRAKVKWKPKQQIRITLLLGWICNRCERAILILC